MDRHAWVETVERVRPGLLRLPLPLDDNPLRAVNVYLIEESSELTLVDTGWTGPDHLERLVAALHAVDHAVDDVTRVLVTHLHMDHIGQADAVRRRSGAAVHVGRPERAGFDALVTAPHTVLTDRADRLVSAGADQIAAEVLRSDPPDLTWGRPDVFLDGGETIATGDGQLEVIATPGHTQGHVSFFDRERSLLISGDHVLPHITPSIGFEPFATGTALGDFLSSLVLVRDLPVDVVLPAHGPVFTDLRSRVDELTRHHVARLDECLAVLPPGGATAHEVTRVLRWTSRGRTYEELDGFNRMLAVLETLAHFELLVSRGRACVVADGGVHRFQAAVDHAADGP